MSLHSCFPRLHFIFHAIHSLLFFSTLSITHLFPPSSSTHSSFSLPHCLLFSYLIPFFPPRFHVSFSFPRPFLFYFISFSFPVFLFIPGTTAHFIPFHSSLLIFYGRFASFYSIPSPLFLHPTHSRLLPFHSRFAPSHPTLNHFMSVLLPPTFVSSYSIPFPTIPSGFPPCHPHSRTLS